MKRILEVPEFCCAAGRYGEDFDGVCALDVSTCRLIELANYDLDGSKSAAAFVHMPSQQFEKKYVVKHAITNLISAFTGCGGVLDSARVLIYGGRYHDKARYNIISQLLIEVFNINGVTIGPEHFVRDMWMNTPNQSIEFILPASSALYLKMVDPDDEAQDTYPEQLSVREREALCRMLGSVRGQSHNTLQFNTSFRLSQIANNRGSDRMVQDRNLLLTNVIARGDSRYMSNVSDSCGLLTQAALRDEYVSSPHTPGNR